MRRWWRAGGGGIAAILLLVPLTLGPAACQPSPATQPNTAPAETGRPDAEASPGEVRCPEPAAPGDSLRVDGEFGLWVRLDGDSLRASWITRPAGPGFLQITVEGERLERLSTPPGISHTRAFPDPGRRAVLLDYGAVEDPGDRHQTRLRLHADTLRPSVQVRGVDSLFVVGDIHGEYDNLIRVLRNAGLIDGELRWSGGRSHLVVLGDMMSRGSDVTAVLWLLYRLEGEAEEAGGRIHVVLGNHEIMVMLDDLCYVQPKEAWIAEVHGTGYDRMFDPRLSVLGRWLASKPAVLRVDDVLLAHGGVSDDYLDYTVRTHRDSLAAFMGEDLFYHWADPSVSIQIDSVAFHRRADFFWGERSVFWYRDYAAPVAESVAAPDEPTERSVAERAEELRSVLRRYRSRIHVIGHTPVPTIQEAYEGSLILVNTIDFASELLLLVRADGTYERYRYRMWGPPEPL